MVRVKHRYLLIDILYPDPSSASPSGRSDKQSQLRIHAPTSDALTPSLLAKMVRDEVAEIFGDWGIGRLGGVGAGGVSGTFFFSFPANLSHYVTERSNGCPVGMETLISCLYQ